MKRWIHRFRLPGAARQAESEYRRGLRIALIEGIPANIIGALLGGPLQTAYLLFLHFNSEQVGIVLAIPSITLLVQIFVALAMQKWQNRRLLSALSGIAHRVFWILTGFIPLLAPQSAWAPTYIALFLLSFTSMQIGGIIWTSLMADAVPAAVRGKYFGIRNTVHFAVVCATLLIGGQILERLPGGRGFAVIYAVCAVCLLWNGWALFRYPNPPFQPSAGGSSAAMLIRPFADSAFISAVLFISLFLFAQNIAVPLFSYAMLNVLKLSYGQVTFITMLQNVAMMVSYYYWGILNGRYPARKLLLWTFPLIAAACVLWAGMAALAAVPVLIVAHILLGVGAGGYNLLVFNFLIGDSPKSERPIYVAIFSALTGFAGFLGPLAGGWLYKEASGGPAWIVSYGLPAMTGAGLMLLALGAAPVVFKPRSKTPVHLNQGA